ncbi:MAG: restriction endonuclease subunit [Candidatus Saccharibacteria bacterium]|nr:restriction endonuclease subunit [Candidatus Saccharibacteria bacterium]
MLVKLKDVVTFHRGLTYKKLDEVAISSNIVLRANNIDLDTFSLNFNELRYISDTISIPNSKILQKDSILICVASGSRSHLGKVAYIDQDYGCAFGGFMGMFLPKNEDVYMRYIFKIFISSHFRKLVDGLTDGTNINNLKFSLIENFEFNLPTVEEQRRIVAKLDAAFEKITKATKLTQENVNNSRKFFEYELEKLLRKQDDDWKMKTLKDVSIDFGRGKSKHRPRNDKILYGGRYPFIQTGDVRGSEHVIIKYKQTYNDLGLAQSKLWPKGTICITIAANIAETGVLNFDACFPDSVIGITVNPNETINDYVEYLLQAFKTKLQSMGKGSAQDNINLSTFENQTFPFPGIEKQRAIVDRLNKLLHQAVALESTYRRKLTEFNMMKQSMLNEAFLESAVE